MLINISEYLKSTNPLDSTYRGVVVDNLDPLKLKRVKVLIDGLIVGENEDLPWCYQLETSGLGNLPDTGTFSVPKINSIVEITFPNGNIYSPYYKPRHDALSHQEVFDENYPEKYGLIDEGFKFLVDRTKVEASIEHPSGTKVTILEDGTIELNTVKELKLVIADKLNINSVSDITINSDAKVKLVSASDLELDGSGGKLKLSSGKVGIGGSEELVDLVSQIADTLSKSLCNLGVPLNTSSQFAALKTKIDSIKGGI